VRFGNDRAVIPLRVFFQGFAHLEIPLVLLRVGRVLLEILFRVEDGQAQILAGTGRTRPPWPSLSASHL
jgi:hypothetical protein